MSLVCITRLIGKYCEVIKKKRHGQLTLGVLFHYNNVTLPASHTTTATIHNYGFKIIWHLPYYPNMASADFICSDI